MRDMIAARQELRYAMAAAVWICPAASWAQNYPSKAIRWVIPFDAGTSSDVVGRILADRLSRLWGPSPAIGHEFRSKGSFTLRRMRTLDPYVHNETMRIVCEIDNAGPMALGVQGRRNLRIVTTFAGTALASLAP